MEDKYWQQFVMTGSIADYLYYCREKNRDGRERPMQGEADGRKRYGDRDDFVGAADRRIR